MNIDEGKLYTWGYGSIKLGYETANEKQLTPKVVQSLSSHTVVQASCGRDFTLGMLLTRLQKDEKTLNNVVPIINIELFFIFF
jgi:alpha-tubulin suppressor-like RCC1 family protein